MGLLEPFWPTLAASVVSLSPPIPYMLAFSSQFPGPTPGRLDMAGFRDHLYTGGSRSLATSDFTPRPVRLSKCLLYFPQALKLIKCKKDTFSPRPGPDPVFPSHKRNHTQSQQSRQRASRCPGTSLHSQLLVPRLSSHPHDSCPTRRRIHHLYPEHSSLFPTRCPTSWLPFHPIVHMPSEQFLISTHTYYPLPKTPLWELPGGPVVKNLPSSVGDMGSIPGCELRSHMPWGSRLSL